jgi:hypothetical protein
MFEDLGVPPRIEIVGSIGRILIDEVENRWEINARAGEDRTQPPGLYWLPLLPIPLQHAEFDMVEMLTDGLKELLDDGEMSCTGEDGLASLEMVIGAHVSSEGGSALVQLPLSEHYQQVDVPLT